MKIKYNYLNGQTYIEKVFTPPSPDECQRGAVISWANGRVYFGDQILFGIADDDVITVEIHTSDKIEIHKNPKYKSSIDIDTMTARQRRKWNQHMTKMYWPNDSILFDVALDEELELLLEGEDEE